MINIILNSERLSEPNKDVLYSTVHQCSRVSSQDHWVRNEMDSIYIGKEEVKLPLLADGMILNIENTK